MREIRTLRSRWRAGNGMMDDPKRARNRKTGKQAKVNLNITASVLDLRTSWTGNGELKMVR